MHTDKQPQANPGMMIQAGGNRNAKNLPIDAHGREWSHGLCSCCDEPGLCFKAWCCSCIVYAQNKKRLDHLNRQGTADPEHGGGCCSGACTFHLCLNGLCGLGWILAMSNRGSARDRYRVKGGGCGDCCTSFWCAPCAAVQESREIELEEKSLTGGR